MRCTGNCNQGKDCTCQDLPIQYSQDQLDEWRREIDREAVELWIIVACLVMLVLIVLGVMTGVV